MKMMRREDWNEEWKDHPPEEDEEPDEYCVRCGLPYLPRESDENLCEECREVLICGAEGEG